MAAPNIKEIEWAIQELENEESSEGRYQLLAALYTCRNEMTGQPTSNHGIATYSEMAAPVIDTLGRYGDSEFLQAVEGLDPAAAWAVMDEHMNTLRVVNPRVYDGVMRKLRNL